VAMAFAVCPPAAMVPAQPSSLKSEGSLFCASRTHSSASFGLWQLGRKTELGRRSTGALEVRCAIEEAAAPARVPDTAPNRSTPWWVTRTSSSVSGVFSSVHVMQSTCGGD
jgi:hypothetical protein